MTKLVDDLINLIEMLEKNYKVGDKVIVFTFGGLYLPVEIVDIRKEFWWASNKTYYFRMLVDSGLGKKGEIKKGSKNMIVGKITENLLKKLLKCYQDEDDECYMKIVNKVRGN